MSVRIPPAGAGAAEVLDHQAEVLGAGGSGPGTGHRIRCPFLPVGLTRKTLGNRGAAGQIGRIARRRRERRPWKRLRANGSARAAQLGARRIRADQASATRMPPM